MSDAISKELFERARKVIPGGVNSPVRAFRAVGGEPVFIREAAGPYLTGADGKKYVDFIGSWGPMILGHAHPKVVEAMRQAIGRGTTYGAPTEGEIDIAETIIDAVPSIEMVRLTSSGTEAVMGALRVARGYTKRDLILKFEGCYHGGADYLLTKAGSGLATFGVPDSAGVPASIAATSLTVQYNNLDAVRQVFKERGSEIAAVILEPVVGNMGCVPPDAGYLQGLRDITKQHGALLVFDEVMTGFRLAYGGAQARFGVIPDLTTLGKIVGGGVPVGAYGGRRDIMENIAPVGPVYQAGTLSGNPLAVAAGLATLRQLRDEAGAYERLETISASVESAIVSSAKKAGVKCTVQRVGSMLTVFFTDRKVRSFDDASTSDTKAFGRFHAALLEGGVYWPPSQYEAAFVSLSHDDDALTSFRNAVDGAFAAVSGRH